MPSTPQLSLFGGRTHQQDRLRGRTAGLAEAAISIKRLQASPKLCEILPKNFQILQHTICYLYLGAPPLGIAILS